MSGFGSVNTITVSGNLGRDPEFGFSANGTPISKFSIAISGWDGNKETTMWLRITSFQKLAEFCEKWLLKGTYVIVAGRLTSNKWEDKEGGMHETYGIIASDITVVKGGNSKSGSTVVEKNSGQNSTDSSEEWID